MGPGTEGDGSFSVIPCVGGFAGIFRCDRVDLVAQLSLSDLGAPPGVSLNDLWGWTDPSNGREYALVARSDGVTFVDVGDPGSPRVVGHLPSAGVASSWRDVKVYRNHAYVVADRSVGHGIQIFDLMRLRGVSSFTTFTEDGRYTDVSSVHNLAINEATGFAYATGSSGGGTTCGGGLHMIDLSNPLAPVFAGCFADPSTGRLSTGYTHDVQCVLYVGPDGDYAGREVCFGSNETALSISDVTDKANPVAISTATYPALQYAHQGWLTEDHRFFIQNDELDEFQATNTRMLVWDVADLDDPILVKEFLGPNGATDHNVYIVGPLAYQSNYHFGLRVVNIASPGQPRDVGFFDTHPSDDAPGFEGSWSNYPFFASGIVTVTSKDEGLFVLKARP